MYLLVSLVLAFAFSTTQDPRYRHIPYLRRRNVCLDFLGSAVRSQWETTNNADYEVRGLQVARPAFLNFLWLHSKSRP